MGSESNLHYLEVVKQPLARLCRRAEGLTLKIVCEKPLELEGVAVTHKLFSPADEVKDLHSFDVAIAPLVEDPWTRGKVSTKILAYMAVGLPVVASDVASNRLYVRTGENAVLAGTLSAWEESLAKLLAEPAERERLGAAARASVEREFSIGAVVPKYLELFRGLAPAEKP
jgi:glycosyltransferase involved in cell wall biosynthesis